MINSRVGGSVELQRVSLHNDEGHASTSSVHPNAVTPSNHPPLMPDQRGSRLMPTLESHAAAMGVALRHTELLARFQVEQASVGPSNAPKVSEHAALLIGGMLELANKDKPEADKAGFEVMAERLCAPRFALRQFESSEVRQLLNRFVSKDQVPDKAEVGRLLEGHATAIADQLEHFQLMHIAARSSVGGSARDQKTVETSQMALGEYAARASNAVSGALSEKIKDLDERVSVLDQRIKGLGEGDEKSRLMADKTAIVEARTMLASIQDDFSKTPQAKRLKSVAAHAQLDKQVKELNAERASMGFLQAAGRITAAAIPQFLSSMTHLGFIRTSTSDKMTDAVPSASSDADMLKATVIGLVAGVAHEGVTNVVKPMVQAGIQAAGLDKRLGMVPLKGVDTATVIPDPLEYKTQDGRMVRKSDDEMTAQKAQVKEQRAILEQQKVQVSSTHPLGEMIPYMSFGGGQAIRQLLHDFNQINGQTLTARALTSGMAGAVSASAQTLYQMNATYTDPQGRKIPVFTPDKAGSDLVKDLAKGLDPRDAGVRTSFYSKAVSGIQSAALTAQLPATAKAGVNGALSAGKIVGNMALAGLGSVSYLSTLYANQSVTGEAKALKDSGAGGATPMVARTETALNNIRHPDRESLPHTFSSSQMGGVPRVAENAYHMARGALQLPSQVAVDLLRAVEDGALSGLSSLRDKLKTQPQSPTTPPRPSSEEPVETIRVNDPVTPGNPTPLPQDLSRTRRPESVAPPDDNTLEALENGLLVASPTPVTQRASLQAKVSTGHKSAPVPPVDDDALRAMEEGKAKA
ncbi:restriction endonuclease [Pseudomonas floridensis]|uniref:Restriction endonuclease n=1 Tax=Pseudomonas floridensis TaxID=1958950 RepID=A0A1X0N6Z1_9PSED|nr:restriction endonuclease [Pseudomonas floridensis]ORC59115.1 restriction endonuclease [Pseudomonas floridensis]